MNASCFIWIYSVLYTEPSHRMGAKEIVPPKNTNIFLRRAMGWLQLVGSIKLQVSFAEYRLFYRALLQKRPLILSILLTVATPYLFGAHPKNGFMVIKLCGGAISRSPSHQKKKLKGYLYGAYPKHGFMFLNFVGGLLWEMILDHMGEPLLLISRNRPLTKFKNMKPFLGWAP